MLNYNHMFPSQASQSNAVK